jgi:hypothetical protein
MLEVELECRRVDPVVEVLLAEEPGRVGSLEGVRGCWGVTGGVSGEVAVVV